MKKEKPVIVQDPEHPIERNVLARAIVDIGKAMTVLQRSGLSFEAVAILTHHRMSTSVRIPIRDVKMVMANLAALAEEYTH